MPLILKQTFEIKLKLTSGHYICCVHRLICLFELNSGHYICNEDLSIWNVSMLHKKTGGIIHFKDYNGEIYDYDDEIYLSII